MVLFGMKTQLALGLVRPMAFHTFLLQNGKDDLVEHGAVGDTDGLTVGKWNSDNLRKQKNSDKNTDTWGVCHGTDRFAGQVVNESCPSR